MLLLRYFLVYDGGVRTKMLMGANPLRKAFKKIKNGQKELKKIKFEKNVQTDSNILYLRLF